MNPDLTPFLFGVFSGACALFLPWIGPAYRKYVVNCGKVAGCPHHSPDNARRLNNRNDSERNGPTRPKL